MKLTYLALTCALALIYSCSKNDDAAITPPPPPYLGTPDDSVIVFPDSALNVVVRDRIHKMSAPILYKDIKNLDTLNVFNRPFAGYVKNLEGVQFCKSLKVIRLYTQDIDNLNVFKNLASLIELKLLPDGSTKSIRDITPLQNLHLLKEVWLDGNDITDITPLLSSSAQLRTLSLSSNRNLNLINIEKLVNLEDLNLSSTNSSDLTFLQNLKNLKYLSLLNNHITDITPLKDLIQLKEIYSGYNNISSLTALQNLTQLEVLYLMNNNISDISPLANLAQLINLSVETNHISKLNALEALNKLKYLYIYENDISDITPLINGVPALEELFIHDQTTGKISKAQRDAFNVSHPQVIIYWGD